LRTRYANAGAKHEAGDSGSCPSTKEKGSPDDNDSYVTGAIIESLSNGEYGIYRDTRINHGTGSGHHLNPRYGAATVLVYPDRRIAFELSASDTNNLDTKIAYFARIRAIVKADAPMFIISVADAWGFEPSQARLTKLKRKREKGWQPTIDEMVARGYGWRERT